MNQPKRLSLQIFDDYLDVFEKRRKDCQIALTKINEYSNRKDDNSKYLSSHSKFMNNIT